MKFSSETRYNLIKYALKNINLHYIIDNKNFNLNDLLAQNIIIDTLYITSRQMEDYDKIIDNRLNNLIHYTLSVISVEGQYYIEMLQYLLDIMSCNNIGKDKSLDDIILDSERDIQLVERCELYLELYSARQNKNGQYQDNEIAADRFLFEKVIKQAAIDLYKESNVKQKIKGVDDIGQSLVADTIIKHETWQLLIDAKFYKNRLFKDGKYIYQNNRFQMSSYMTEIRDTQCVRDDNIRGLIVHSVDSDRFIQYEEFNGHSMNIGHNMINLELVNIDCTAEDIIKQIKEILKRYI